MRPLVPIKLESLCNMNFKMSAEFNRCFELAAFARGMTKKELLEASFRLWVDKYSNAKEEGFLSEDWDTSFVSRDGRAVRDKLARTPLLSDRPDTDTPHELT